MNERGINTLRCSGNFYACWGGRRGVHTVLIFDRVYRVCLAGCLLVS